MHANKVFWFCKFSWVLLCIYVYDCECIIIYIFFSYWPGYWVMHRFFCCYSSLPSFFMLWNVAPPPPDDPVAAVEAVGLGVVLFIEVLLLIWLNFVPVVATELTDVDDVLVLLCGCCCCCALLSASFFVMLLLLDRDISRSANFFHSSSRSRSRFFSLFFHTQKGRKTD